MDSIPRNVILDLLPAYMAGEAREETRALVEEFARNDPQIARLIRAGAVEPAAATPNGVQPADLKVKAIKRNRRSIRRQLWYVALATAFLLMVPWAAMQFTPEVNWDETDFIVMGILLFGTGLTYVLITRMSDNVAYRVAVGIAVAAGLILIWLNLAVGLIGSENNPANTLYFGVFVVGISGAGIARLRPRGMARTLYATALAQALVPVLAMMIWKPSITVEETPGIAGVFILNGFFVGLFVVSALLFRRASAADRP